MEGMREVHTIAHVDAVEESPTSTRSSAKARLCSYRVASAAQRSKGKLMRVWLHGSIIEGDVLILLV